MSIHARTIKHLLLVFFVLVPWIAIADEIVVLPPRPIDRKFPAVTWCQIQEIYYFEATSCTTFVDFGVKLTGPDGQSFGLVAIDDVLVTRNLLQNPECTICPYNTHPDGSPWFHNWCYTSNGAPALEEDFSSSDWTTRWILGPGASVGFVNGSQALRFQPGAGVPSAPCDTARARLVLTGLAPGFQYSVTAWWSVQSPAPGVPFFGVGFSRPAICAGQPGCTNGNCYHFPNTTTQCSVHWNGPGGDIWNTNSSPANVNPANPFNVLWSVESDEGQLHRPSGLALVDVGAASTPDLFGTTGWWQNRTYRASRTNGTTTSWLSADGENDSGTGFRVAADPVGTRVYQVDVGNVVRAYPAASNPAGSPLWTYDGDAGPRGIASMIKTSPDGRVFGHYNGTTALSPTTGAVTWQSAGNPENAIVPGAFFDAGFEVRYVVSGTTNKITSYNINAPSGALPSWTYTDTETGASGPTVDPSTGSIYVFRQTRLIKLLWSGALVWASPPVGNGEWGESYGALSRDRQTFYYQTAGPDCSGKLYAFDTSTGSIRWSYPTNARGSIYYGGPVVSANRMIYVANGAEAPHDNRVFCLLDQGTYAALVGTFDLNDHFDTGAPWLSIDRSGVVYMDGWGTPDAPRLWAFKGPAGTVSAEVELSSEGLDVPNPLRSGGRIAFRLPSARSATLTIHDVLGRRMVTRTFSAATNVAGAGATGLSMSIQWDGRADDGRSLSSGMYVVRVTSVDGTLAKKVMVLQ